MTTRTLKLTENDCIFKYYADHTPNLDGKDKQEIYEVAAKFK